MRLNRERLIRFYDTRDARDGMGSHVSAITALLGEDLLLALLRAYWREQGYESRVLSYRCKGKGAKGKRLDAWVVRERDTERLLFQVEIKNWAAYSLGEQPLPADADDSQVATRALSQWNWYFQEATISHEAVAKVLTLGMKKPAGYEDVPVLPLVCFWFAISNAAPACYSIRAFPSASPFAELHVFSGSMFVRSQTGLEIDLSDFGLPRAAARLELLDELILGRAKSG